ncbi:major facilitator superfamily protein [Hirsutella rhossiliensis]|uniref:Major facilitator superfamily domain-containing protein n=1 Tax=Hirsutella rhossiliensis TaxID=111463 RepID=A0A9P8MZJ0_9HYPO|nr:major facilitator superfamily domain-containing protein [Hirsutella rhossiliensis]KAH0964918.1 major facilitator superfamily domain-containing protein [Hirsutella rhossiliensis]
MDSDGGVPPPGTVQLLEGHGAGKDGKVVLAPAPSDDPNDPLRWPMWRKCLNFGLLVAQTTALFTGLSIPTIFWPQMLKELPQFKQQDLANAAAVQLVGLAVGCIVFIPFSKKYGRRLVYILVMAIAAIGAWWLALMKTMADLYLSNLLIGIAGAVNQTAIAMSINDIFFIHQRGTANGAFFGAIMAGSFLTPMAAGIQGITSGWRASFASLATSMSILTVVFIVALEETKFVPAVRQTSLDDQDSMYRMDSAESDLKALAAVTELERGSQDDPMSQPPSKPSFLRGARLQLITKTDESLWKVFYFPIYSWWFPHVVFSWLQLGSSICWLVVMASVLTIVFSEPPYSFDAAGLGYMTGGQAVGSVFGAIYGGYCVDKTIIWRAKRNGGWFEPEMRLWLYPFPAIAMAAGLVIFGVSADRGMHWIVPSVGGALFAFSFGAISDISTALVLDSFPNIVSQTFVTITFFRNAISMSGPFSVTPWLERMSVSNVFIVAAIISLAINALAIPLAIWGKKARRSVASRYEYLSNQSE